MTVEERVANGIRFFEQHAPGWHERIYPQVLRVQSLHNCPAAQVFRGQSADPYSHALDLGGRRMRREREEWASDHGFYEADMDYDALNKEWRRQLTEIRVTRRAPERVLVGT